jgi:transposase
LCVAVCLTTQGKYQELYPLLNERQRRIWAATEALSIGWGGISAVSKSTGLSRNTISRGIEDIEDDIRLPSRCIRRKGGGRKKLEHYDLSLRSDILNYVYPTTRGDPESPLRWTSKSLMNIVNALKTQDSTRKVSVSVVRRILHEEGFSLQANRKTREGGNHPDRDKQFYFIAETKNLTLGDGDPVISIDAKKKELIGNYKNQGQEWHPKGQPTPVQVYDFPQKDGYKAVPYGIYDIAKNKGFVNIGVSADTAVFAGKSILKWWEEVGKFDYPNATRLLILADGGGSNSSRTRLWKVILQELADKLRIPITVCHYPPGTSKWNPIEHRLWAPISLNWREQPLESLEIIKELISHTTTTKGLEVTCQLDMEKYKRGIKISDRWMTRLWIKREKFRGNWNYTMFPRRKGKN